MKPAPCPTCKSAIYFRRDGKPTCANCEQPPSEAKLGIVVGTPENYSWSVLDAELGEIEARRREAQGELPTPVLDVWEKAVG